MRSLATNQRTYKMGEEPHDALAWMGGNVPADQPEEPGDIHDAISDAAHNVWRLGQLQAQAADGLKMLGEHITDPYVRGILDGVKRLMPERSQTLVYLERCIESMRKMALELDP